MSSINPQATEQRKQS